MDIDILHLVEGALKARGLTVIIDVFRAFSMECYAFEKGVEQIIPVGDIKEAYALKEAHPEYILAGERKEQRPEGFDYGNSPKAILEADLKGKTLVHTTSAGTQGIVNAIHAKEIITGSFVNAGAIAKYIRERNPEKVSLVDMGYSAKYPAAEDVACASYLAAKLRNEEVDFEKMKDHIRNSSGKRFFVEEKQSYAPREDFELCLNLNRFNFVLKVYETGGLKTIKKITI